jgi:hypothetical protein
LKKFGRWTASLNLKLEGLLWVLDSTGLTATSQFRPKADDPNSGECSVPPVHYFEKSIMQTSKVFAAELATWNSGRGISSLDWIINTGSFTQFTAYARLIFPEFVEVQDRLYLADLFTQERLDELRKGSDDRNAQVFMNVIDLSTMFCDADRQSDDEIRELGRFLKKHGQPALLLPFLTVKFISFLTTILKSKVLGNYLFHW